MMNELARNLSYAKEKVQYDAQCKQILSQKEILAWILQRTVKVFNHMAITDIISCIEGTPEVSSVPVYPGYDIVTRGIFYVSRMISAQLSTEFSKSDYDNIKKVYSIWICMHSPNHIGNAISCYHIAKKDLLPGLPDVPKSYDKISVVIIALNETTSSDDKFINMMNTLLSIHKTAKEKRSILENTYHISMSYDLGKELSKMDHVLDDVIEEKLAEGLEKGLAEGLAKGLAKGRSEGFSEGRSNAKKEVVINLLKLNSISDKEILEVADISLEELQQIKDETTALV